jgi:hypothetical protein
MVFFVHFVLHDIPEFDDLWSFIIWRGCCDRGGDALSA